MRLSGKEYETGLAEGQFRHGLGTASLKIFTCLKNTLCPIMSASIESLYIGSRHQPPSTQELTPTRFMREPGERLRGSSEVIRGSQ